MPKPRVKKPREEEPNDQLTKLNAADLTSQLDLMKDKCNDLKQKRNYIQMDRDMVQQYFQNTENDILNLKTDIINRETDAQNLERNHNVQVKLYLQRVKHLEFEQQRSNLEIEKDGENGQNKENEHYERRVEVQNSQKQDFRKRHLQSQKKYNDDVSVLQTDHENKEQILRQNYVRDFQQIQRGYQARLVQLKEELDLKLKVEVHEVQERKNLHINDLMRNHEQAFIQLKGYYNDITSDNLKLIREHKAEIRKINQASDINKKTITDLTNSNRDLEGPLDSLRRDRDRLKVILKQFGKHKMSLQNYKSKHHVLKEKLIRLEKDFSQLNLRLDGVEVSKNDLQHKYSNIAQQVKNSANLSNKQLHQRLVSLSDHLNEMEGQMQQIMHQASLDPRLVMEINQKVEFTVKEKNQSIKSLKYSIEHATKAYNDAIRVYEAKLVEFGVPPEELGFQPLDTLTSTMPAGLVSS